MELTDVSVASTCHQYLEIHTPRVLGVGVGIAQEIQRVALAKIGR